MIPPPTRAEFLNLRPEEAVRHFRAKGLHVGFDWRDTDAQQHLVSFTAAKAARLDILTALRDEVDRAIADGLTQKQFRDTLEPRLRALGWWGRETLTDPVTGKTRTVELGSPRRLGIIYDTNLRMAYAHGRWQRIERLAEARPYLRYVAVGDSQTRPEHLHWHGTILPIDHPFWRSHAPPNGWRCRCTVVQLSDADLDEFNWRVTDPPDDWTHTRLWRDTRNGKTVQVPVGIDPGFQHNVGRISLEKDAADRLIHKIDAAPDLGRAVIGKPWAGSVFRQFLKTAETGSEHGDFPIAWLPNSPASPIGAASRTVRLSGETAAKQAGRRRRTVRDIGHPDVRPRDYAAVQQILDEGQLFQSSPHHILGFIEMEGVIWKAVIKSTLDGRGTYLMTLHRTKPSALRAAQRFTRIETPNRPR